MKRVRGTALTVLVVAVAALAVIASQAAGAANSRVTVGIGFEPAGASPFFRGLVKSGRKSCISERPVRVYRQLSARRRVLFGSGRSGADGSWRVPLAATMKTGGYVAVVKAKPGCAKGFSDRIAVGQRGPGGSGPGGSGA